MSKSERKTFISYIVLLIFVLIFFSIEKFFNTKESAEEIAKKVVEKTEEIKDQPSLDLTDFESEFEEIKDEEKSISLMLKEYSFKNFPITAEGVAKESRLIKLVGKLKSATLNISANTNKHSAVYFYIDSGAKGGLIDATRNENESRIISGGFKYQEDYNKSFDLKLLDISNKPQGNIKIPVLDILNDNKWHYFIGFVNSEGGILKNFSIDYECEGSCNLEVKKP